MPYRHSTNLQDSFPEKAGQAMIEFIIGLVALLVLFAGLLQIIEVGRVRTEKMFEARAEAGRLAIMELGQGEAFISDADFIEDWEIDEDEYKYQLSRL